MTVNSPEPTPLSHWLRRLWPFYCFLAILVNFGYALYDSYQIDGDAVSYMDIADLMRAHNWAGVINGYWNPLYPAFLTLGHAIFHPTRYTELHACYMVNFGIFLLEMLAVVAFSDALVQLRDLRETVSTASSSLPFLLDRYSLRYLGVAILVISTQREVSIGKVRPDALLQAFLLFALAALFRHLATARVRYAALDGHCSRSRLSDEVLRVSVHFALRYGSGRLPAFLATARSCARSGLGSPRTHLLLRCCWPLHRSALETEAPLRLRRLRKPQLRLVRCRHRKDASPAVPDEPLRRR